MLGPKVSPLLTIDKIGQQYMSQEMEDILPQMEMMSSVWGFLLSAIVAFSCSVGNVFLKRTHALEPPLVKSDVYLSWKWRNFLISVVHSVISGAGALFCLYEEPLLVKDLVQTYTKAAYFLVCTSHGYFCYDCVLRLLNLSYKGSLEVICHHILLMACFSFTIWEQKYVGCSTVALIVELSNIFLHFRQLLKMTGVCEKSRAYRTNRAVNFVVFMMCRIFPVSWILGSLVSYKDVVDTVPYIVASITVPIIFAMSLGLLYRLVVADCFEVPGKKVE